MLIICDSVETGAAANRRLRSAPSESRASHRYTGQGLVSRPRSLAVQITDMADADMAAARARRRATLKVRVSSLFSSPALRLAHPRAARQRRCVPSPPRLPLVACSALTASPSSGARFVFVPPRPRIGACSTGSACADGPRHSAPPSRAVGARESG